MTGEQISSEIRSLTLRRREIAAEDREIGTRLAELHRRVFDWSEEQGLSVLKGEGVTCTIDEEPTAQVEDMVALLRWQLEHGIDVTTHTRVSAKKLNTVAANGLAVPEFITLGSRRVVRVTGVK